MNKALNSSSIRKEKFKEIRELERKGARMNIVLE